MVIRYRSLVALWSLGVVVCQCKKWIITVQVSSHRQCVVSIIISKRNLAPVITRWIHIYNCRQYCPNASREAGLSQWVIFEMNLKKYIVPVHAPGNLLKIRFLVRNIRPALTQHIIAVDRRRGKNNGLSHFVLQEIPEVQEMNWRFIFVYSPFHLRCLCVA